MKNVVIWGYGLNGAWLYRYILQGKEYKVIGFADNSVSKQGMYVDDFEICSIEDLAKMYQKERFSVIISTKKYRDIARQLEEFSIPIEGVYVGSGILEYKNIGFERLDLSKKVKLYAGDICDEVHMQEEDLYGLSINKADFKHIYHDITEKYPLPDNCITSYQAEDVLEHISIEKLVTAIDEIYRILVSDGLFRICLPDYYSPFLKRISMRDVQGNIVYDPTGGGSYENNAVNGGGHVWFPNYKNVRALLEQTKFKKIYFLCYHTEEGKLIKEDIDFSMGYINRISENGRNDGEIYSIVVDCYK